MSNLKGAPIQYSEGALLVDCLNRYDPTDFGDNMVLQLPPPNALKPGDVIAVEHVGGDNNNIYVSSDDFYSGAGEGAVELTTGDFRVFQVISTGKHKWAIVGGLNSTFGDSGLSLEDIIEELGDGGSQLYSNVGGAVFEQILAALEDSESNFRNELYSFIAAEIANDGSDINNAIDDLIAP